MPVLFLLTHAAGNWDAGCFHGAWLFPGWSFAVLTGSHGHSRGHGMHRANQRLPCHHLLCFYRLAWTRSCDWSSWCCVSFVLFTVRLYWMVSVSLCDAAGFHVFPTFVLYELTILLALTLTLVIMKVQTTPVFCLCFCFFFFVKLQFLLHLTPYFLPVCDGCTRAVSNLASRVSAHTVDRLCWSRSGQRVFLRPGQSCASSWHHLQRGQWLPLMLVLTSFLLFRQRRIY